MSTRIGTWTARLSGLAIVTLEGAGILWRGAWWQRVLLNAANIGVFVAIDRAGNRTIALGYVVAALLVHYLHLFLALKPGGLSDALRARLGTEAAFRVFKSALATSLFHFWASIALCLKFTAREDVFGLPASLVLVVGGLLGTAGTVARVWAVWLIGVDAYYCRDFFFPAKGEYRRTGPYRYFSNPMYSLGYAAGYGPCLAAGSWEGVLAMAVGQALIYLFYVAIERPHLERVYVDAPRAQAQAA